MHSFFPSLPHFFLFFSISLPSFISLCFHPSSSSSFPLFPSLCLSFIFPPFCSLPVYLHSVIKRLFLIVSFHPKLIKVICIQYKRLPLPTPHRVFSFKISFSWKKRKAVCSLSLSYNYVS